MDFHKRQKFLLYTVPPIARRFFRFGVFLFAGDFVGGVFCAFDLVGVCRVRDFNTTGLSSDCLIFVITGFAASSIFLARWCLLRPLRVAPVRVDLLVTGRADVVCFRRAFETFVGVIGRIHAGS